MVAAAHRSPHMAKWDDLVLAVPRPVSGRLEDPATMSLLETLLATEEEQLTLLRRLRHVVDAALEDHPSSPDLRQLRRDLEEAYLLVGAVETG